LAWQAHLSNQILTVTTITNAQNDAPQSQTQALTKLKRVRKCLRNPKSPADIVRASIGFLEVCDHLPLNGKKTKKMQNVCTNC
jgi:uncharacterized protein (DUF2384 family)